MKPTSNRQQAPVILMATVILLFGSLSAYYTLKQDKTVPDPVVLQEQEIKAKLDSLAVDYTANTTPTAAPEKAPASSESSGSPEVSRPALAPAAPLPKAEPSRDAPKKSNPIKEAPKQTSPAAPAPIAPSASAKKSPSLETKAPVAPNIAEQPTVQQGPTEPALKPVTARPLVAPKPRVLMATKEKAWVRIDDLRTVIVKKGDSLPELGRVLELDDKAVKFEKGTFPVTSE